MRRFRGLVVAVVLAAAGWGCTKDVKSSIPPPSDDDKPMGTPRTHGASKGKQRLAK
jgi:hypothetical protein